MSLHENNDVPVKQNRQVIRTRVKFITHHDVEKFSLLSYIYLEWILFVNVGHAIVTQH